MRALITAIFRFTLRLFFRRIELSGRERVPTGGRVIFVLNHPNALVDPAFMLCFSPRKTTFLAKSTIFPIPVLGWMTRSLECLPIYRKVDHAHVDPAQNRATFDAAHTLLDRGLSLAIFPEGASHCDPKLRPLKTGAARIALGAAASGTGPLWIVPVGLFYTAKTTFRSSALLLFSEPIAVSPATLDSDGEPPRDRVTALTDEITAALFDVTLQADTTEALRLVRRAEELFAEGDEGLSERFELRRRILEGYSEVKARRPTEVASIEARLRRMEALFGELGLPPGRLSPEVFRTARIARYTASKLALFTALAPLALVGIVTHLIPYRLVDTVAKRVSHGEDDMLSTLKILGAQLIFPASWLLWAALGWLGHSWQVGLATLVLVPASGWAALHFTEQLDRFAVALRALTVFVRRGAQVRALAAEQEAIRGAIIRLSEEVS